MKPGRAEDPAPRVDPGQESFEARFDALAAQIELRSGPIPTQFLRTFEGMPFQACSFCNRLLLDPGLLPYRIVKFSQGGELRQELAICQV